MRIKALVRGDILLQFKYGFYFLYAFFTLFYLALLSALPSEPRRFVGILLIFTDPGALGLFFMGAIVLYEKSERVLDSLAVSPLQTWEYVLSKLLSLGLVSAGSASVIALYAGLTLHPLLFLYCVFAGSALFSSLGLIVAVRIKTLNEFIICSVPFQILINIPAFAYAFGWDPPWLILHPGVCILEILGSGPRSLAAALILPAWALASFFLATRSVDRALVSLGGVKL